MSEEKEQDGGSAPGPQGGRPMMPADYGIKEPKSGSGLRSWSETTGKIAAAHNYWIGTTRPDGRPHAMPVWGLWLNESFFFSTGRRSRKALNLAHAPYLVVHLESGDDVVILEGTAREVTDQALLAEFVEAYDKKYSFRPDPKDANNAYYTLDLRVAFAWLESDFVGGATRWQF
jgi:nitroimidazol reductase NimA-like FMN-containing flavoprotein (pyridoxamine 5'-phosphate oxidase superfamily)